MADATADVEIQGVSPLLMHRFPMEPIEAVEKKSPSEQAELAAYRSSEGLGLYIPGMALQRACVQGALYSKGRGRASLQKAAAACLVVSPEYLVLDPQQYVVDSRPVVVPATKGRVLRHRPRFDAWKVRFRIQWDNTLLTEQQVRKVLDDTGRNVGVLDFRPEHKGPFGRFVVIHWENNEG